MLATKKVVSLEEHVAAAFVFKGEELVGWSITSNCAKLPQSRLVFRKAVISVAIEAVMISRLVSKYILCY